MRGTSRKGSPHPAPAARVLETRSPPGGEIGSLWTENGICRCCVFLSLMLKVGVFPFPVSHTHTVQGDQQVGLGGRTRERFPQSLWALQPHSPSCPRPAPDLQGPEQVTLPQSPPQLGQLSLGPVLGTQGLAQSRSGGRWKQNRWTVR